MLKSKRTVSMLLAIVIMLSIGCVGTFASDLDENTGLSNIEGVFMTREEILKAYPFLEYVEAEGTAMSRATYYWALDFGVSALHHRAVPATTGTSLGLIYPGETLQNNTLDAYLNTEEGTLWRYVYRPQTGLWGFCALEYIVRVYPVK